MKNFAKLLVVALSVAIIASLFAISSSAAVFVDPNTLTPASERVIFIKDAPRDENNQLTGEELPGDGTGSDADNPFKIIDHESFDPTAEHPKWHLQTAFYQATELLKEDGGTIVVCGPVYFGIGESYGSGGTTRDVFTAKFGEKTIKVTSVYNGVDYRETAGAKITIALPAEIGMQGQSIWENIDIETADTNRVISFNNYATLVGEGVKCYPADEAFEGVAANYVSLSAGHRYSGGVDLSTNLVVKSGTYNIIAAGEWGVNNQRKLKEDGSISWTNNLEGNTSANLVIDGTTTVYGRVIGTNTQNADFSGNTSITINGGKFECDIYGVGHTGMLNADGQAVVKINGGDFTNAWSINSVVEGFKNNAPASSILDFSGWTGDISGLAAAFGVVTEFSKIVFPEGITQQMVIDAYANITQAPEVEETEEPKEEETKAEVEETKAEAEETKAEVEETKAPETEGTTAPEKEEGDSNIGLIIGIVVAVVAVVVIVVVVATKKKKA